MFPNLLSNGERKKKQTVIWKQKSSFYFPPNVDSSKENSTRSIFIFRCFFFSSLFNMAKIEQGFGGRQTTKELLYLKELYISTFKLKKIKQEKIIFIHNAQLFSRS